MYASTVWSLAKQCCASNSDSHSQPHFKSSQGKGRNLGDSDHKGRKTLNLKRKKGRFLKSRFEEIPPPIGGRQLRRLALLAFARQIDQSSCSLDEFLESLKCVITEEIEKRDLEDFMDNEYDELDT